MLKIRKTKLTKISLSLLAILTCYSTCLSQLDTTYTFHYPLNIGDIWEYEYILMGQVFAIERNEVIGDTLMPNGKTYRIIDTDFPLSGVKYQRVNSMRVYQFYHEFEPLNRPIYDEFLLFNLNLKIGDTWLYPPKNYDGFLADSGYVEVIQIENRNFSSNKYLAAVLGSFTLPDSGNWYYEDVMLFDSVGVIEDSFEGGWYNLRGAIINGKKLGIITNVESIEDNSLNMNISSLYNYPNPFNNSTIIEYKLYTPGEIRISIFTLMGARISVLNGGFQNSGLNRIFWLGDDSTGKPVSSGIYFYTVQLGNKILAKNSMLLLR